MSGWAASGFADAYTNARQQQLSIVSYPSLECRHQAPQSQRYGHNISPVSLVCKPGDRNAHCYIKNSKRKPREQSQLRIGQLQFLFYGFPKNDQELPVYKVEDVNQGQHQQHIVAV